MSAFGAKRTFAAAQSQTLRRIALANSALSLTLKSSVKAFIIDPCGADAGVEMAMTERRQRAKPEPRQYHEIGAHRAALLAFGELMGIAVGAQLPGLGEAGRPGIISGGGVAGVVAVLLEQVDQAE